jgi:hypothetical protein
MYKYGVRVQVQVQVQSASTSTSTKRRTCEYKYKATSHIGNMKNELTQINLVQQDLMGWFTQTDM